jgi:hypothetical protein
MRYCRLVDRNNASKEIEPTLRSKTGTDERVTATGENPGARVNGTRTHEVGDGIKPRVSPRTRGPTRATTRTDEVGDGPQPKIPTVIFDFMRTNRSRCCDIKRNGLADGYMVDVVSQNP